MSPLRRGRAIERSDASLSVVVPAYNVADYLADSLASILDQSHQALEVVVVDDGSTDGTGDLADRIADADPRVRVVHQANAGLGAARNAGVGHASGEYLAFADSDDLVVEDAYARLVGSLEHTGSDLADRGGGALRRRPPLHDAADAPEPRADGVRADRIDDAPLMLADVFAVNKVYRRAFWDEPT